MDFTQIILGKIFFIIGGMFLYTYVRKNNKYCFKKNDYKNVYGKKLGTFFHFMIYVVLPMTIGMFFILNEFI